MTRARSIPDVPGHGAPVSFLIDYDGTIALRDVAEALLVEHHTDSAWRQLDDAYLEGRMGSRRLIEWDIANLVHDAATLEATADALPHDGTFVEFVRLVASVGAALEVVSDGFGFYVVSGLAGLGLAGVPIATSDFDPRREPWNVLFPFGHPTCLVCGTCKRERVRAHQALGRAVVFIGDGASDRYAAAHADVVFAKERLARVCASEGWPWLPWDTFADVAAWTGLALAGGELPVSREAFPEWREQRGTRGFICGPEVWGPGVVDPPEVT